MSYATFLETEEERALPEAVDRPDAPDVVRFCRDELGFDPDLRQEEVLRCDSKRVILNCARQWGKSTVAAAKAVYKALTEPEILILFASPGERQSRIFIGKARRFVSRLGLPVRGDGDNSASLKLPNGSVIVGLPGKEETVRGYSGVSLMMIDEAARVPEALYKALRPMLAVKDGTLWMMSTPFGKQGVFYDTWQHGGERWARFLAPVNECPRISAEFLAEEREVHGDAWFRQEYLCEFVENGGSVFAREIVEAALTDEVVSCQLPVVSSGSVFVAVDLGKMGDFTAIAVLEREEQRQAWGAPAYGGIRVRHLERLALGTPYTLVVDRVQGIVEKMPRCRLVVDASGVGEPVVDMLRKSRLPCGLTAVSITSGERASRRADGWNVPRQDLVSGVQMLLERGELRIPRGLKEAGTLAKELIRMRSDGGGGEHDDLVLAVALGCWAAGRPENGFGTRRLV